MKKHHNNPDKCTACTVCVAHCPVTAATNKFRGPKMVGPANERMRLSQEEYDPSLDFCTNCKNCDISCPSGVPISTLNMLARAKYYKTHNHKLRDKILTQGEQMGKMGRYIPPALMNFGTTIGQKLGITELVGISKHAPMPPYASKSFMQLLKNFPQQSYPNKVVFYAGCFINYNDPQVGLDIVAVMQKNKYEVIVEDDFVCCGSPFVVNGYLEEAEEHARKNTAIFKKWTDKGYSIITGCTSCLLMLKQEYQELFHIDGVSENANHLYDCSEFLLSLHEKGKLNTDFGTINEKYIYHAPCHLRAQGMGIPALDLLNMIPGLKIENADAGCCGISGNYGFKSEKNEISNKIGEKLFNRIKTSGATKTVSECGTCRLQIGQKTKIATTHPISILRAAYDKK